jgi:outer membrane lipoprotein-sorting protein
MTKTQRLMSLCLCTVLTLAGSAAKTSDQSPDAGADLEEVLSRLEEKVSGIQTLKADFVQEKFLAVLDEPLLLKGTIMMQKPDLFSWIVREPLRYSMVIQGEVVRQWDEDTRRVEKISLSKNPVFKMAIQQLRDWLSGAYRSMLGQYEVKVLDQSPISLEFVPRETALAQGVVDRVTVEFDRDERYIWRIQIFEKQGDRTLITFANTLLNAPIAPTAWKVEQDVR